MTPAEKKDATRNAATRRLPEFIKTLRINRAARRESVYASDNVYALLDALDTAEARVRELEAMLAETQGQRRQWQEASVRDRAALAEAYERAAKVADEHRAHVPNHDPEMQSDDLVAQGYGNAAFNIAVAIRNLAQEERHAKAE